MTFYNLPTLQQIVALLSFSKVVAVDYFAFPPKVVGIKYKDDLYTYGTLELSRSAGDSLYCVTEGAKTVQWRRNTSTSLQPHWMISRDNATITLSKFEVSYNADTYIGSYECVATNDYGCAFSAPLKITFPGNNVYTEFTVGGTPTFLTAPIGSTAVATCNSSGSMQLFTNRLYDLMWVVQVPGRQGGFGRLDMQPLFGKRFGVTESGTMYLMGVSVNDATNDSSFMNCYIKSEDFASGQIFVGQYKLATTKPAQRPASIQLIFNSTSTATLEGYFSRITCIFEDPFEPYEQVLWARENGQPLQPDVLLLFGGSTTLYIKVTRADHEGVYLCSYPSSQSNGSVRLTVLSRPAINETLLQDTYAPVGMTVQFVCQVRSTLLSSFGWYYNDAVISTGNRFTKSTLNQLTSVLTITDTRMEDAGVVSCAATNANGRAVRNVRFIIYSRPTSTMHIFGKSMHHELQDVGPQLNLSCSITLDLRANLNSVYFTIGTGFDSKTLSATDNTYEVIPYDGEIVVMKTYESTINYEYDFNSTDEKQCSCTARFIIFQKSFYETSDVLLLTYPNENSTMQQNSFDISEGTISGSSKFEQFIEHYWWLGIIIFSIAVIAVVLGVNIVYRRRRAELLKLQQAHEPGAVQKHHEEHKGIRHSSTASMKRPRNNGSSTKANARKHSATFHPVRHASAGVK